MRTPCPSRVSTRDLNLVPRCEGILEVQVRHARLSGTYRAAAVTNVWGLRLSSAGLANESTRSRTRYDDAAGTACSNALPAAQLLLESLSPAPAAGKEMCVSHLGSACADGRMRPARAGPGACAHPTTYNIPILKGLESYKYLGVLINIELNWQPQIKAVHNKVQYHAQLLRKCFPVRARLRKQH